MKLLKKNIGKALLICFIIIINFLPYNAIFSRAEEVDANEENLIENLSEDGIETISNEYELVANLWDTNQYSEGTGTQLTEDGIVIDGWQYETSKFLQIDPSVPADGSTYVITVKVPQEFYIVASELPTPAGYQSVEFTKNESIEINDNFSYDLNTYSGTAEYTLNIMGVSGTIQLEIAYDKILWDKQAGSNLTPDGVEPIVVILSKKDSDGNLTQLKKVSVSKATAKDSFPDPMGPYQLIEGEANETTGVVTILQDKKITIKYKATSDMVGYKYFPLMTVTINLPYYTDSSGVKHYLPIDTDSIAHPIVEYTSQEIDTSLMESDGIVVVKVKNVYYKKGTVIEFTLGPLNEELKELDENSFAFTDGKITISVDGKNGNTITNWANTTIYKIEYQKELLESVSMSVLSKGVTIVERPENAVSILGGFYLENLGTGDSCAKTLYYVFDNQNTNYIKVTTINTLADTVQEYIDITYTLVDENGDRVFLDSDGNKVSENDSGAIGEWIYSMKNYYYNSSSKSNIKNKLTRNMLPEGQRKYYFKTLKYTINKIESQAKLYAQSANSSLSGTGNFFGYVDDNNTSGKKVTSTMEVTSSNPSISTISKTSTATLENTSGPTYGVDNVKMSKTSIQAGESVTTTGQIIAITYPYGNSTWIKAITIGALLPKDVSINEQSIVLKSVATGKVIEDFTISTEDVGNGNILWKIKLPSDVYIGVATEELGNLESGTSISFSMQLDTSYTMNGATLFARDIFMVAAYNQTNSGSGSYSWTKKTDTYDLNETGSTTDNIGGVIVTNSRSCQVVSQTATLDIEDNITIERQGSVTQETSEGALLSQNDIVNYNLDIGCFSGGRAEGFSYFIPIPKTTSVTDNFLIKDSDTGKFDFELKEAVSISGSDIFNIEYIFENGVTYDVAQTITTWYTAEDIENDSNLNFADATMIRLTVKGDGIQNGDESRITVKMIYGGEAYLAEAGMENIWQSGGFYKHINSDRESAGNFSTSGVSVKVSFSLDMDDLEAITLTAAQNMQPLLPGNTNTVTVEKDKFPAFKNSHTFSITAVETYNVVLQTKDYIEKNTDMAGIDANKTFAITVSMPDGTETNILTSASTTPILVGKSDANDSPEFTYKIYNADAITDNSQTRYIVVTLTSNNGITIKQKIDINREIAQASDPKSAIVAGKRYLTFDDTTTQVTISQDSAFTTQFIVEYIPYIYSNQQVIFSENLPKGTNIILENLTDSNNPTYWYYKINSEVSNIELNKFISMGKINSEYYSLPDGIDMIEEKLLLIIDFSQCENGFLDEDTYTVKMELIGNNGVEDFSTDDLEFITKNKSEYALKSIDNVVIGNEFNIDYSINLTTGAESKYEGRKLSLVITAPDDVPSDMNLTVKDVTYYLNSKNQFIIPLGDIENPSESLSMKLFSNMLPDSKSEYEFEASLWISGTANSEAPKFGEIIGTQTFTATSDGIEKPSLKVTKLNKRIIHKSDLSKTFTAEYKYISANNCYVTVELQQKIGTAYQKVTDRLNQVNNTTQHNIGVFNISAVNGTNEIEFKLSSSTSNSTYRLVFKVYDESGTQLLEVPYNFIVLD